VNEGGLFLNSSTPNAIAGNLTVGDGASPAATVTLLQNDQVPDTRTLVVNSDGTFELNGHTETINTVQVSDGAIDSGSDGKLTTSSLTMTGGSISLDTTAARLRLTGNVTATSDAMGSATVKGPGAISLEGGSRTITVNHGTGATVTSDLVFTANVLDDLSSGKTLTRAGAGRLEIDSNVAVLMSLTAGDTQADGTMTDVILSGGPPSGDRTARQNPGSRSPRPPGPHAPGA